MKKLLKLTAFCTLLSITAGTAVPASAVAAEARPAEAFVHTSGQYIIGADGHIINLRGISLGNSVYNNPSAPDTRHHSEDTYRELAELGFNCVRFYLNYGIFEDDANPYEYKAAGFDWLDENIRWAKKYGIGIIFNMHFPQGGYQSSGNGLALWTKQENQDRLTALWKEIARRYAGEPTVWGYGLVNEPVVAYEGSLELTRGHFQQVMQRLATEIRAVAPYQMLFVEGICHVRDPEGKETFSYELFSPEQAFPQIDDDNVVYEFHNYNPFRFTHQNADWAGTANITASYPSREIISYTNINGWTGCLSAATQEDMTTGWRYFESDYATLTTEANTITAAVNARQIGSDGSAYFDDIVLTEISPDGTQTVLYSADFSHDTTRDFYAWSPDGTGTMEYCTKEGKQAAGCLKISGAISDFTASAKSFEMQEGCKYFISGYIKATKPDPAIRMDFSLRTDIKTADADNLEATFLPYVDFSRRYNVPVYLGEFGVIASGYEENRNGTGWVQDMIAICQKYNIGYNYHTYNECNFGFYLNYPSGRNEALAQVFQECNRHGQQTELIHSLLYKTIRAVARYITVKWN